MPLKLLKCQRYVTLGPFQSQILYGAPLLYFEIGIFAQALDHPQLKTLVVEFCGRQHIRLLFLVSICVFLQGDENL